MSVDDGVSAEDCGCAPTPRELRALRGPLSRRAAIGLGVLGVGAMGLAFGPAAFAADYPSWDDVQRAKSNEASKAAEVSRIEGLINSLQADVAYKQAEAERLGAEYVAAQEAFEDAAYRATDLQAQADAEAARAQESAGKLGRLAAQQYRNGSEDASLELFFSGSAASADDLLAKLGTMDKLVAANRGIYADAVSARDNAQNLSNQASVARDERDKLQKEAEAKMVAAQDAATAAQAALDAQTANLGTLQAQLAALKDTTAKTIADYQAGVEAERQARLAREAAAREAARQAAAAAAAQAAADAAAAAAAAAAGGGGGGGGSSSGGTGGQSGGSGWARPASGWISSWFGGRGTICGNGYCVTDHRGIDFATNCGNSIYAAASGRVIFAAYSGSWGNYIKIDHGGGIVTGYAHIRAGGYAVGVGQSVSAGQVIAYVGSTGASSGCHLHFEVYSGGVRIDPAPFLRNRGVSV
ncbi:M23 family metallopeptidase [uncultured Microbacterium sp.]|uniref:M23 family metallopeptidase n=1 Tax=uncultured Microbacterium sp. TaxID=191216 RepID=UPI0026100725|nr:M23 family metallopeptidase [uncultured Microbacterium sp.]